jgi:hypothetical protein
MARKSQNTTTNVVDSGATSSHDEDMQTSGHRTVGSKRKRAASKKQELIGTLLISFDTVQMLSYWRVEFLRQRSDREEACKACKAREREQENEG